MKESPMTDAGGKIDWLCALRHAAALILGVLSAAACSPSPAGNQTLSVTQSSAQPAAPPSKAPDRVEVYFDKGSNTLSADADQKLDQVARLYREGSPLVMFVAGHSDTDGAEYPNLVLSGQRARTTKDALVARGIPADRLQIQALGSSLPADPNAPPPDNNRRVVITWR